MTVLFCIFSVQERQNWTMRGGLGVARAGTSLLTPSALFRGQQSQQASAEGGGTDATTLFELTFEKNPLQSSADYK